MGDFSGRFRGILALCAALLLLPATGQAGAWQREKGAGFLSLSGQYTRRYPDVFGYGAGNDRYLSVYGEYGLRPKLTIGIDLGHDPDRDPRLFLFTQKPLRQTDHGWQVTYGTGTGLIGETSWSSLRLSVGRGLSNGWITADGEILFALPDPEASESEQNVIYDWKLDVTYGRNLKKGRKGIVQAQFSRAYEQDLLLRIAPSYVVPLQKDKIHLEAGGIFGLVGGEALGAKLSLWYAF